MKIKKTPFSKDTFFSSFFENAVTMSVKPNTYKECNLMDLISQNSFAPFLVNLFVFVFLAQTRLYKTIIYYKVSL